MITNLISPHLQKPIGRPLKKQATGKVREHRISYRHFAKSATGRGKGRKVFWENYSQILFIVANLRFEMSRVVKVYNMRGDVENRIKEGKNILS